MMVLRFLNNHGASFWPLKMFDVWYGMSLSECNDCTILGWIYKYSRSDPDRVIEFFVSTFAKFFFL